MAVFINIGATAETDNTPCHSVEQWLAMLDALDRKDVAAVERLIAAPPTMVPTASMHPVGVEDATTHAAEFWRRYAERSDSPKRAKRGETEVSVAPNKSSEEVNRALQHIAGGPQS